MKKIILTLCLGLLACCHLGAQPTKSFKTLSLELGKTGVIYNLTFDTKSTEAKYGFRAFIGSNLGQYVQLLNVGGGAYYLTGNNLKFLELGTDISLLLVGVVSDDQVGFANLVAPNDDTKTLYATFNFGYRRYGQHTLFRVGVAPGFTNKGFLPGGYISFGLRL